MNKEDAEEYTQSLGQIVGGSYRQIRLAQKLGVPEALGLDLTDWVNSRLGGYVRYAAEDRRPIAKELDAEGLSQRQIGEVLGVDPMTVNRDLRAVANATENSENGGENVANATRAFEPDDESLFDLQGRDPQDFQAATQAVGAAQQMLHTINARSLAPDRVARGFLDDDARLEQFAIDLEFLSKWIVRTRNLIEEESQHATRRRA